MQNPLRNSGSPAILASIALILSGGCASINARWDMCEKNATTFVQVSDCTINL